MKRATSTDTTKAFDKWLDENAQHLPLSSWGPTHTQIACAFADYLVEQESVGAVRRVLDQALNSGDGSYRP